jgi:hypothetical protein
MMNTRAAICLRELIAEADARRCATGVVWQVQAGKDVKRKNRRFSTGSCDAVRGGG